MSRVTASASKQIQAPADRALEFLRDYRESRPKILTENYTNYRVEAGGEGSGTVIAYHFATGRRERDYRLRVEQQDGALIESDELSSFVAKWTIATEGAGSTVTLEGSWEGAGGVGGIFEGLFAPMVLRRIYAQLLSRLADALGS